MCISTACVSQKKFSSASHLLAPSLKIICIDQLYFSVDDGMALHVEQDALEDLIEEFGVYTETVDIAFDEEELSDSDGEEDQHTHDEEENDQAHDDEEDEQAHDDVDDDQAHHDQA